MLPHVTQALPTATSFTSERFSEEIPPSSAAEQTRLNWLLDSLARGQSFLQSNTAYKFIDLAVELILGTIVESVPRNMSKAHVNILKRQIRDIIATQTNLNPEWAYECDFPDRTALQLVTMFNKRIKAWWKGRAFPMRKIKEAHQHAATAAGYISLNWEQGLFGSNEEDVGIKVFGPKEVIPDGIAKDWDLQKAKAVHICHTTPTTQAKDLWPLQSFKINSDRLPSVAEGKQSGGGNINNSNAKNFFSKTFKSAAFQGMFGRTSSSPVDNTRLGAPFPEVDIFWTYVIDNSYNCTGNFLDSGMLAVTDGDHAVDPNVSWYYKIPPYTPSGEYTKDECALYPARRLLIWTRSGILYDGPNFYWHGRVPIVKFSMDQWVFEFLGGCTVEENRASQASFTTLLRYVLDTLMLRLDPPLYFKESEVTEKKMKAMKLRSFGERIGVTGRVDNPIGPVLPYQHYEPSMQTLPWMEKLLGLMNHMLGTEDWAALGKLGQVPSAEGIDKILQSMSAIMTDYALTTERSLTEVGYQFLWLSLQFDDAKKRLHAGGTEALTDADLDWDPGIAIPAHVQYESVFTNSSRYHRARAWGRKFRFGITPLSSFRITDAQQKLMFFQLFREPNFPMDPQTLAQKMGLENFGTIPGNTILERWANWQMMKAPFLAQLQAEAMGIAAVGQAKAQVAAQYVQATAQQEMMQRVLAQSPKGPQIQMIMQMAQKTGDQELMAYAQSLIQQELANAGVQGALGINAEPTNEPFEPPELVDPTGGVEAIPATNAEGRPPQSKAPPTMYTKPGLDGAGPRSGVKESR